METFNHLNEEQTAELEQGRREDQRAFNVAMTFTVFALGVTALFLYLILTALI
jgi:hypothetical protein